MAKFDPNDVLVDIDSTRPAGKDDECFYCRQRIGSKHKFGCVLRYAPAIAHIRRNSDGIIRECKTTFPIDEPSDYIWSEGNWSCDCNRELFFCEAAGEDEYSGECGDTRFTVLKICLEDGTTVYSEE